MSTPIDRLAAGLDAAIDRAEAAARLCPRCGRPGMHKAGFTWSGKNRRQVWRCQGCGKTQMERKANPLSNTINEYTPGERLDIRTLGNVWREKEK